MNPERKRKIRLVVALSAAVLLAAGLVYVSFSSSSEAKQPSDLLASSGGGGSYEVTGVVSPGSVAHQGDQLRFRMADREDASESIPVRYRGTVPDPFREGREVIITGTYSNGTLVGERDSLITKCPSKFSEDAQQNPDQVMITTPQ